MLAGQSGREVDLMSPLTLVQSPPPDVKEEEENEEKGEPEKEEKPEKVTMAS